MKRSIAVTDDEELLRLRRDMHPTWSDEELLVSGRGDQQMDTDYLAHGDFKPSTPWPGLFKELIVPALAVTGDAAEGICIDVDTEKGIADLGNPNVTVVRVQDAAHCIRREQPERFYAFVDDFLATH